MKEKLANFIQQYRYDYLKYLGEDFEARIYEGYTKDNVLVNQIYIYLNLVPFAETEYQTFIKTINRYFDLKNKMQVMEIASGIIPVLSIRLKQENPHLRISCLDKSIIVKDLPELNIIESDFNFNLELDNEDLIYAFRPCFITEDIIKYCLEHKKEFVICLCSCALKPKEAYDTTNWNTDKWHDYLYEIANKYNPGDFEIIRSNDACLAIVGILKK